MQWGLKRLFEPHIQGKYGQGATHDDAFPSMRQSSTFKTAIWGSKCHQFSYLFMTFLVPVWKSWKNHDSQPLILRLPPALSSKSSKSSKSTIIHPLGTTARYHTQVHDIDLYVISAYKALSNVRFALKLPFSLSPDPQIQKAISPTSERTVHDSMSSPTPPWLVSRSNRHHVLPNPSLYDPPRSHSTTSKATLRSVASSRSLPTGTRTTINPGRF